MTPPEEVPAAYADTGERCAVTITTDARGVKTFRVGKRYVNRLSPTHCSDGRRLVKADVAGAFGAF